MPKWTENPILIGGKQKNQAIKTDGICTALTSAMGEGGGYIPMVIEAKCKVAGTLEGAGFEKMFEEIRRVYDPDGTSPAVTAKRGGYHEVKIINVNKNGVCVNEPMAFDEQNGYVRTDGIVGTLTTDGSSPKKNNRIIDSGVTEDLRIRKLTPRECWRLMDFDDEDFDKASAIESNTQLYKQAGNSIVVNCLVAIFGQLFDGKENAYKERRT